MNDIQTNGAVFKMLNALSNKTDVQNVLYRTLDTLAKLLSRETKTQFDTLPIKKTDTTRKTRTRVGSICRDPYALFVSISILRAKLGRWFESGTDERYTKNNAYRGKLRAYKFFQLARMNIMDRWDWAREIKAQIDILTLRNKGYV